MEFFLCFPNMFLLKQVFRPCLEIMLSLFLVHLGSFAAPVPPTLPVKVKRSVVLDVLSLLAVGVARVWNKRILYLAWKTSGIFCIHFSLT